MYEQECEFRNHNIIIIRFLPFQSCKIVAIVLIEFASYAKFLQSFSFQWTSTIYILLFDYIVDNHNYYHIEGFLKILQKLHIQDDELFL